MISVTWTFRSPKFSNMLTLVFPNWSSLHPPMLTKNKCNVRHDELELQVSCRSCTHTCAMFAKVVAVVSSGLIGCYFVCFADSTRVVNCLVWYAFVFRSCVKRFSLTVHADESRSRDRIQRHVTSCELFFLLCYLYFFLLLFYFGGAHKLIQKKNFIFNSHRYSASECSGWGCGCVCVCVGLVKRSVSSEWIHSFHIKISDDMWWRRRLLRYLLCLYTDRWQRYERWNKRTDIRQRWWTNWKIKLVNILSYGNGEWNIFRIFSFLLCFFMFSFLLFTYTAGVRLLLFVLVDLVIIKNTLKKYLVMKCDFFNVL